MDAGSNSHTGSTPKLSASHTGARGMRPATAPAVSQAKGKLPVRALTTHPLQPATFLDDSITPVDRRLDEPELAPLQRDSRDSLHSQHSLRSLRSLHSQDSHDLSLDIHRYSVVDNMLQSLEAMPAMAQPGGVFRHQGPGLYSRYDDSGFDGEDDDEHDEAEDEDDHHHDYYADSHFAAEPPQPIRKRGHTYTSSRSTEFEIRLQNQTAAAAAAAAHYANSHSRIRNNSSSNVVPADIYGRSSVNHSRSSSKTPTITTLDGRSVLHKRGLGKKGSKSSAGSNDLGYGHAITTRWDHGRATSIDQSIRDGIDRTAPASNPPNSILNRGRPTVSGYSPFEAAPEPTVPQGPRRSSHSRGPSYSVFPPQSSSYPSPTSPVFPRTDSAQAQPGQPSQKGAAKFETPSASIRAQAKEFVNGSTNLRDYPPVPPFDNQQAIPSAPTTPGRRHQQAQPTATPTTQPLPKEKQGFFRRLLGSSKNNSPVAHQNTVSAMHPLNSIDINAVDSPHRARGHAHQSSNPLKALPDPPGGDSYFPEPPREPPPPPLVKKPSSFFRRKRKGSVSSTKAAPPPLPSQLITGIESPFDVASPGTSSLLKAMSPFLGHDSPAATPGESKFEQQKKAQTDTSIANGASIAAVLDNARSAHIAPGHTSQIEATNRLAEPESRAAPNNATNLPSRGDALTAPPTRKAPEGPNADAQKLKLKMRRPGASPGRSATEETFLADSSGNEDRSSGLSLNISSVAYEFPPVPTHDQAKGPPAPSTNVQPTSAPVRPEDRGSVTPPRRANIGEKRVEPALRPSTHTSPERKPPHPPTHATGGASEVEEDERAGTKRSGTTSASPASGKHWARLNASPETEKQQQPQQQERPRHPVYSLRRPSMAERPSDGTVPTSPDSANDDVFHSATSLPTFHLDGANMVEADASAVAPEAAQAAATAPVTATETTAAVAPIVLTANSDPTIEEREKASMVFAGNEDIVSKANAAAWLGDAAPDAVRIRKAFMELFEWNGCSIIFALRELCGRITMIAEAQQLDRIIDNFSHRWCECNPEHGFKADDVVHSICYAAFLLNTDLHRADHDSRMTKHQFVKNTLPTIKRIIADSNSESANDSRRPSEVKFMRGPPGAQDSAVVSVAVTPTSPTFPPDVFIGADERPSLDVRSQHRLSARPMFRSPSEGPGSHGDGTDISSLLVRSEGPPRNWEAQLETVLKEIYSSISRQPLPLHSHNGTQHENQSTNSLSVAGVLRRTPSVLSKTPSETMSYRGRLHATTSRWSTKRRQRPGLYPASTVGSSRTSLEDGAIWTPVASSTWSRYTLGKSYNGLSVESLGSHFGQGDYSQSIGFANALSHVIIREESSLTSPMYEDFNRTTPLLDDDSLELEGAPWAKEGMLKHKHHLEGPNKRHKKGDWEDCFAVIEKGVLRLFSFTTPSKSFRQKSRKPVPGGIVGGGNWTDSASVIGTLPLRHTIASILPPPGYSKARPFVWALNMPNGALHLFQVTSDDIIKEFVSTANFWAARMSKEPLIGGVSNIEYGWGDNIVNGRPTTRAATSPTVVSRAGVYSSGRASTTSGTMEHGVSFKARLPGDRANISEWGPPTQTLRASNLTQDEQLQHLQDYVKSVEDDLTKHNELRCSMTVCFTPRAPNYNKAMTNWEKKSAYLLKELVKFKTYVDSLNEAKLAKERVYTTRREKGEDVPEPYPGDDTEESINADIPAVKVNFENPFNPDKPLDDVPATTTA